MWLTLTQIHIKQNTNKIFKNFSKQGIVLVLASIEEMMENMEAGDWLERWLSD